jgi:hypothetical protein
MGEARHEPGPHRIEAAGYNDRNGFCHTLQRLSHKIAAARYDHIGFATDEFCCDLIYPLKLPLRGPTIQYEVLAIDVSEGA